MPPKSRPSGGHILHHTAGVANPRAAGSIAANGARSQPCGMTQGGTGLTPAPWMSAAYLNMEERFVRIGEATDSFLSRGGFGDIFLGHDSLTRVNVVIKRQPAATPQAGREHASYNMLQAFRHPNIIRMCGIWTAEYKKQPHLYIAMEACSTDLWHFIRVDNPRSHQHFV